MIELINHVTIGHFLYRRAFLNAELIFFRSSSPPLIKGITHSFCGMKHPRLFRAFGEMDLVKRATLCEGGEGTEF